MYTEPTTTISMIANIKRNNNVFHKGDVSLPRCKKQTSCTEACKKARPIIALVKKGLGRA
jgi:hypothetical protein